MDLDSAGLRVGRVDRVLDHLRRSPRQICAAIDQDCWQVSHGDLNLPIGRIVARLGLTNGTLHNVRQFARLGRWRRGFGKIHQFSDDRAEPMRLLGNQLGRAASFGSDNWLASSCDRPLMTASGLFISCAAPGGHFPDGDHRAAAQDLGLGVLQAVDSIRQAARKDFGLLRGFGRCEGPGSSRMR